MTLSHKKDSNLTIYVPNSIPFDFKLGTTRLILLHVKMYLPL